ncbi:YslB family protein [Microbacteriaceae bacterium 4G12]
MSTKATIEQLQQIQVNAFAYELLREQLIPDLIGKERNRILYWAGKNLARNYPLESFEEVISFFIDAGWGELTIIEQKRREMQLQLVGSLITERYRSKRHSTYQLEAGFIAQQIQQQRGVITETYEEQKKRSDKVLFTVKWDPKDITED